MNQSEFICTGCGNTVNADLNAAFNIALKGQERLKLLADKTLRLLGGRVLRLHLYAGRRLRRRLTL